MKKFKQTTIDDILKEYYSTIYNDKLDDRNIDIDDSLEVENTGQEYLKSFAKFLNQSYYRGYIISENIFSKLLDIIKYDGYEYKLFKAYEKILVDNMISENAELPETELLPEDAKDFINAYSDIYENNETPVPHYNIDKKDLQEPVSIKVLSLEEYPTNLIYEQLCKGKVVESEQIARMSYVLYKNNEPAYERMTTYLNTTKAIFFLLDNTDDRSIDILMNAIFSSGNDVTSLDVVTQLIKDYDTFINDGYDNFDLSENAAYNIEKIIELIHLKMPLNYMVNVISKDIHVYKSFVNNNSLKYKTIQSMVDFYNDNEEEYLAYELVELRNIVSSNVYNYTEYFFYTRNIILNMDYTKVLDNFYDIIKIIDTKLKPDEILSIMKTFIYNLVKLRNKIIDDDLIEFHNKLAIKLSSKDCEYFIYNNYLRNREAIDTSNLKYLNKFIEYMQCQLMYRNNDPVESIIRNVIPDDTPVYEQDGKVLAGTKLNNIEMIAPVDSKFKLVDEFLDENFEKTDSIENSKYIAKYIDATCDYPGYNMVVVSKVSKDKNATFKITLDIHKGKVFLGLYDIDYKNFTVGNIMVDEYFDIYEFTQYCSQLGYCIRYSDRVIIEILRTNTNIKFSTDEEDDHYKKIVLYLSYDFIDRDDVDPITLL